ncbi:MAG: hypothetical protein HYU58_11695 [Proteobacteria bacterium]|nr:hypothetical protein [Pseudomonadota bacterium]
MSVLPSDNIEPYAKPLGALVIACSKLESQLTNLIAAVTEMNIFHAVTTVHHQQFASKADTLLALLRTIFADDKKFDPIVALINDAKVVSDYRNSLVHAIWTFDDKGQATTVKFSARGKLSRSRSLVDIPKIEKNCALAFEIAAKIEDLTRHVRTEQESARSQP